MVAMNTTITVASPILSSVSSAPLTRSQRAALWEIAGYLDELRIPADHDDTVSITIPTKRLRGEHGRDDNAWLHELLERMLGIKFSGMYCGDRWGAVLLAEYRFEQGGSQVRLLLPPTGVKALRAPETFAKVDQEAVHRLPSNALKLYGLLADKQRQKHNWWRLTLPELKAALGLSDKYKSWQDFKRWALEPAVNAINDFGIIHVEWEAEKQGRSFHWITLTWQTKDILGVNGTKKENERHSSARGKEQTSVDAPPLFPDETKAVLMKVTTLIDGCGLKETEEGIIINGRSPQLRDKIRSFHADLCKATGKKVFIQ